MALLKPPFEQALLVVFTTPNQTAQGAAQAMADAYTIYSAGGMAGDAVPAFTGAENAVLFQTLLAAIQDPPTGTAPKIAQAWTNGVMAFWSAPPVAFAGASGAGPVTGVIGIPALLPCLTQTFLNLGNTPQAAAQNIASCLDAATKTVLVTLVPPIGPPFIVPVS